MPDLMCLRAPRNRNREEGLRPTGMKARLWQEKIQEPYRKKS